MYLNYLIEVLPFLAVGFLLSGLIHEFIPTGWVERHLGGKGIKPLLYSTLVGTALPICCIGALPVAVSLHQKGARLGDMDRTVAAELLKRLKEEGEFHELADIEDWKELSEAKVTENLIQQLISRAHRGETHSLQRNQQ